MFDLPSAPSFPVYGLDAHFEGYRWLASWNDWQRLYMVSLGHGHPGAYTRQRRKRSQWITVSTYLKTPLRKIDDGQLIAVGPTGYNDALFGALVDFADRARPGSTQSAAWVTEQLNQVAWGTSDERNAPAHHGPGWADDTTIVDGRSCPSVTRRVNGWWATLVDLPTVALSITGPDSMSNVNSVLDVRVRLADYN